MQLGVDVADVAQRDGAAEQLLVEGRGEGRVQLVPVEQRHAQDAPREVEVRQVLRIHLDIIQLIKYTLKGKLTLRF